MKLRALTEREADLLVTVNDKPWFAVEVKSRQVNPAPTLLLIKECV
ncbi:MAG: hypothetical protein MUF22_01865 [Chitinispirillaceae bacterium]|jgi:hypothetical protein|nr:hypothetical protein [Chitinispirillaceae bacterium]